MLLHAKDEEIGALRNQLADERMKFRMLQEENDHLEARIDELEQEMEQADDRFRALREQKARAIVKLYGKIKEQDQTIADQRKRMLWYLTGLPDTQ